VNAVEGYTVSRMSERDNATSSPAAAYDAHVEQTVPYYRALHEETLRLVETVAGEPGIWLDTGCGTGALVEKALPRFPRTRFLLADPSPAMIEQARAKLAGRGEGRVTFLNPSDSAGVDVGAHRCDVITAILAHHYLDREGRRAALAHCRSLLTDGGLLVHFENVRPSSERALEIGKEYWKTYQMRMGKPAEDAEAHMERFDRQFFPITVAEHLQLLRDTGFATADLLWRSYMQAGFWAIK
jgi:tRNA (cmo5U34)-methyltransferase